MGPCETGRRNRRTQSEATSGDPANSGHHERASLLLSPAVPSLAASCVALLSSPRAAKLFFFAWRRQISPPLAFLLLSFGFSVRPPFSLFSFLIMASSYDRAITVFSPGQRRHTRMQRSRRQTRRDVLPAASLNLLSDSGSWGGQQKQQRRRNEYRTVFDQRR
jgi:hypothetical protein